MADTKQFGLNDYPEHQRALEDQAKNLGMEACATHEQRAAYARRLVRGIFESDLPGVHVVGETQLVYGEGSVTPIQEFERMKNTWKDFPSNELAQIIEQEQARALGEHLRLVDNDQNSEEVAA